LAFTFLAGISVIDFPYLPSLLSLFIFLSYTLNSLNLDSSRTKFLMAFKNRGFLRFPAKAKKLFLASSQIKIKSSPRGFPQDTLRFNPYFQRAAGLSALSFQEKARGRCELQLVPEAILAKNVKIARFKPGMTKKLFKKLKGGAR